MTMTRQDFKLIAEVLKDSLPYEDSNSIEAERGYHEMICNAFADRLSSTNPNFDRTRFLKACGVK